jgi:hypothetical protein
MKVWKSAFASMFLLAGMCAAQDSTVAADQNPDVAAAARANRAKQAQADPQPASDAVSSIDPAKEADIRQLLALSGAAGLATQAMDTMEKTMRPLLTQSLPEGAYRDRLVDLFFEKFHAKRDPNHLMDLLMPIYAKYYTDEDLKGLIALYQTPLGKKMLTVLPKIMAESQAAGGQWGQQLGRDCMIEVLEEHPELRKAMEEAKNRGAQP